jgi:hypothetical protein
MSLWSRSHVVVDLADWIRPGNFLLWNFAPGKFPTVNLLCYQLLRPQKLILKPSSAEIPVLQLGKLLRTWSSSMMMISTVTSITLALKIKLFSLALLGVPCDLWLWVWRSLEPQTFPIPQTETVCPQFQHHESDRSELSFFYRALLSQSDSESLSDSASDDCA